MKGTQEDGIQARHHAPGIPGKSPLTLTSTRLLHHVTIPRSWVAALLPPEMGYCWHTTAAAGKTPLCSLLCMALVYFSSWALFWETRQLGNVLLGQFYAHKLLNGPYITQIQSDSRPAVSGQLHFQRIMTFLDDPKNSRVTKVLLIQ